MIYIPGITNFTGALAVCVLSPIIASASPSIKILFSSRSCAWSDKTAPFCKGHNKLRRSHMQ